MCKENEFDFTWSLDKEKCIIAHFRPGTDSSFFEGHFPDFPVMPGVLLVELSFRILSKVQNIPRNKIIICNLKKLKFLQPVLPGKEIEIRIFPTDGEIRVNAFSCGKQAFSFISTFQRDN